MFKKAILFDLDGVLVDACELHYQALNDALVEHRYDPISRDKHLDVYNGLPTKTKLNLMGLSEEEIKKVSTSKQVLTVKLINEHIHKDEEKISLFKNLQRAGIQLGCVTNCSKETALLMLVKSGLFRYLSVIVTNEDVKDPKPSPEGYNLAMTKLKVSNRDTVVVEDSPKGVMAGKASGSSVVSVSGPKEVTLKLLMRYL